jgi:hypothetical protein
MIINATALQENISNQDIQLGLRGGCIKNTPTKILLFLNCIAKHCDSKVFKVSPHNTIVLVFL